MKPSVFISHGAKDNWVEELRDQLYKALENQGFQPLLDKRELKEAAGENWPGVLHNWVSTCHAAVILIDSRAKDSHWVQAEACWLHLRASRDAFYVLPVGCSLTFDALPPILKETSGMRETQWLDADPNDVSGTIRRILDKLRAEVSSPSDATDPWTTFAMKAAALVASISNSVDTPRPDLYLAAQALGKESDLQAWSPSLPRSARLIDWLFSEQSLVRCAQSINCLAISHDYKLEILKLAAIAGIAMEPLRDVPSMLANGERLFALHPNASVPGYPEPTEWQLHRPFCIGKAPVLKSLLRNEPDSIDGPDRGRSSIEKALTLAVYDLARVCPSGDLKTRETAMRKWKTRTTKDCIIFHVPVYDDDAINPGELGEIIAPASCCIVSQHEQSGLRIVGADAPEDWAFERNLEYSLALEVLR